MITSKRKNFIRSLQDNTIKVKLDSKVFKNKSRYAKYSKKLRHFKKKSKKKNWGVKKHNLRVIYFLTFGKKIKKDNLKKVILLYNIYWINSNKKIRKMKHLKLWLNSIDFNSNFMLLWHITKDTEFKNMLLTGKIRKKSILSFSMVDKKEILLKDFLKMLLINY